MTACASVSGCAVKDGTLAHVLFPGWGLRQVTEVPVSPAPRAWAHLPPPAGAERGPPVRPSLESLLAASSHVLKEVLDGPFVDPLKNLRLPRELNPNKKYSWMQKKDERVRCPGCGLGEWARGRTRCAQRGCLAWALAGCTPRGNSCRPRFCHHLAGRSPASCLLFPASVYHVIMCQGCVPWAAAWGFGESGCVHDRCWPCPSGACGPPRPGHGPAGLAFRSLACTRGVLVRVRVASLL